MVRFNAPLSILLVAVALYVSIVSVVYPSVLPAKQGELHLLPGHEEERHHADNISPTKESIGDNLGTANNEQSPTTTESSSLVKESHPETPVILDKADHLASHHAKLASKTLDDENKAVLASKSDQDPSLPVLETVPCAFGGSPCLVFGNPYNSTCVRYYPQRFFQHSMGARFEDLYHKHVRTEEDYDPFIHMRRKQNYPQSCRPNASEVEIPKTLTYYHIRKNGGSTMSYVLKTKLLPTTPYQRPELYYFKKLSEVGPETFRQQQGQIMHEIASQQSPNDDSAPMAFSFLRDPVTRFLSSIGQVIHNQRFPKYFPDCNVRNTQRLLQCTLQALRDNQTFVDAHLLPQTFELRDTAAGHDVAVVLTDMALIRPLLTILSGARKARVQRRQSRGAAYTGGHKLELSQLTPTMIQDICQLYEMDVVLLLAANVTSTLCAPYYTESVGTSIG